MCDIVGLFGGLPLPLPDEMRKVNLRLLQPTPEEENRGSRHPAQDRTTSHGAESRASERTCSTCRQRRVGPDTLSLFNLTSGPWSSSRQFQKASHIQNVDARGFESVLDAVRVRSPQLLQSSRSSGRDRPTRWRQREVTPCRISLQDTIREFMRMRSALPARTHKTGSSLHNHPLRSAVMGRGRSRAFVIYITRAATHCFPERKALSSPLQSCAPTSKHLCTLEQTGLSWCRARALRQSTVHAGTIL